MKGIKLRLKVFEFLALPGHVWIYLCALIVGYEFTCGAVSGKDGEIGKDE